MNLSKFIITFLLLALIYKPDLVCGKIKKSMCDKHPIYCQIIKNKKRINKKFAMKLSNIIHKTSVKHAIPARLFTAILMQESSYRVNAKGCHWGFRSLTIKLKNKSVTTLEEETKVCSDFGISQIYYRTALAFKFNINKLITDLDYSVEAGAIVLADFRKRYSHREVDWWTRYNARTRYKRNIYEKMVERYM